MAARQFTVRLKGNSGLPEDVYENVLFFDVNAPDTLEGTCDGINAAYAAEPHLAGWNGIEIRVYELAGGQPIFQKTYTTLAPSFNSGPGEVAVCLSYAANDDPGLVGPRRRGRIYIGPLTGGQLQVPRPSSIVKEAVLDLGTALSQIGFGGNTTWLMYSRTDLVTAKIEVIWVDDAWDTQRRRGLSPTGRVLRDVQ